MIVLDALTAGMLAAAVWSILCRINAMDMRVTRWSVIAQHAALGLGLFGALILPLGVAKLCMAAGVLGFLALGSPRWRHGAPPWTASAADPAPPLAEVHEIRRHQARHVSGGSAGAAEGPQGRD